MRLWGAILACNGDPEGKDGPPGPAVGPRCATDPCVADLATDVWEAPPGPGVAGDPLVVWHDTLLVGAPVVQGSYGAEPTVHALTLDGFAPAGAWIGGGFDGTGSAIAVADPDGDGVPLVAVGAFNAQPEDALAGGVFLLEGLPTSTAYVRDAAVASFYSPEHVGVGIRVGFADLVGTGSPWLLASGSGMVPDWEGAVYLLDSSLRGELREEDARLVVRGPPGFGEDSTAWDADGDGVADLIASLSGQRLGWMAGPLPEGTFGEDALSELWTPRPEGPGDCLGDELESVGDVTGDGLADMALAAPNHSGAYERGGRAYVATASDLQPGPADDLPIQVSGEEVGAGMGYGLASGDVDGDGQHDLIVAASGVFPGNVPGTVFVFQGPVAGQLAPADAMALFHGENDVDYLGRAVLAVDVDGDTRDDLLVGAVGWPAGESRGAVYLVQATTLMQ